MLARTMGMPVSELNQRMSGDEFLDHMADCRLLECERERADLRTAAVMVAINNVHGGTLTVDSALRCLRVERVAEGSQSGPPEMTEVQMKGALRMLG